MPSRWQRQILLLWRECRQGRLAELDKLQQRWEAGKGKKVSTLFKEGQQDDQETDWDTEDEDDGDGDDDRRCRHGRGPRAGLVAKEKAPPEIDEDGFIKVTKKKR